MFVKTRERENIVSWDEGKGSIFEIEKDGGLPKAAVSDSNSQKKREM